MSKYAPGAVYIQIMLLEHIEIRILPQIIHAPEAAVPGAAVPSIILGQNLTKAVSRGSGGVVEVHSKITMAGYSTLLHSYCS